MRAVEQAAHVGQEQKARQAGEFEAILGKKMFDKCGKAHAKADKDGDGKV